MNLFVCLFTFFSECMQCLVKKDLSAFWNWKHIQTEWIQSSGPIKVFASYQEVRTELHCCGVTKNRSGGRFVCEWRLVLLDKRRRIELTLKKMPMPGTKSWRWQWSRGVSTIGGLLQLSAISPSSCGILLLVNIRFLYSLCQQKKKNRNLNQGF